MKSNLQLKDGGAKVVGRISNLRQQIAGLEKALPKEKQHTADSSSKVSKMIPIQNLNHQVNFSRSFHCSLYTHSLLFEDFIKIFFPFELLKVLKVRFFKALNVINCIYTQIGQAFAD